MNERATKTMSNLYLSRFQYWPDENTSCLAVGHLEVKAVATRYHNNDIFIRELQLRKNGATVRKVYWNQPCVINWRLIIFGFIFFMECVVCL